MKNVVLLASILSLLASPASAQTPAQLLDQIDAASKALRAQLAPPVPPAPQSVSVATNDDLQAALAKGGSIDIAAGAQLSGSFLVTVPGTVLDGNGATIAGVSGPALAIAPGVHDVTITDLFLSSGADPVALCGRNDDGQTQLAQAPTNITFTRLTVSSHHGKRAFEWNCTGTLQDDVALDTWDPNGQDSQGLAILNSPGATHVVGGKYQAGSEGILVGGDTMKMAGVVPTDIIIEKLEVSRPLSWKTDGVARKVKNLIELKTGRNVTIQNVTLDGSWADGQEGWAMVLTPHSGGDIQHVTVDHVSATNVGGCVQLLGREYAGIPTPNAMSDVVVQNSRCTASKATYGGRGVFVLAGGEPGAFTATNNVVTSDGTSVVYYDPGTVLDPVTGLKRAAGPWTSLTLTGNYLVPGIYGIILNGQPNGGNNANGATTVTITGNTFADAAAALKKNCPQNTFLARVDWDAAIAALGK